MSDEITLKLKIETSDGGQKLDDVNQQMDKIKKNSKETGDSFSASDTKIGKMWKTFSDGSKTAISTMSTLKGAIAATGIGLLLIALKGVVDYFKETKEGSDKLAVVMKVLGSVMREGPLVVLTALKIPLDVVVGYFKTLFSVISNTIGVISGKVGITEALKNVREEFSKNVDKVKADTQALVDNGKQAVDRAKQAAVLAQMIDKANDDERESLLRKQKLETEISQAKADAAEGDVTAAEKKKLFNTALQKEGELYQINLRQAQARLAIADKEIANGDKSEEALQKQAEAQVNLEKVKTDYTQSTIRLNKQITASDKAVGDAEKKMAEDKKKSEAEIQAIRDETVLASLDGIQKEQVAIDQKYAAEYKAAEGNAEKQQALDEKHIADLLALQKKQDDEQQKAEDEQTAKLKEADDQRLKDKEEADKKALEQHQKVLAMEIDNEIQKNQDAFDLGEQSLNDTLERDRDLKLQQAEIETTDKEELEAKKAAIEEDYRQKKKLAEQQLGSEIAQAAISVAGAAANAIFSIQQNRLDQQKEKELSNKNLTEAQKAQISKKYAQKQKELDLKQAVVNGALAILNGFLTKPFVPAGIIAGAVATALVGIQIATIAKTQYAVGGWLNGPKHAQGGIPLGNNQYAEGGEFIVNARTMANPQMAQEIQSLNQAGNTGSIPQQQSLTADDLAIGIANAIGMIPVIVTEHQISLAQSNVAVREQRFTIN